MKRPRRPNLFPQASDSFNASSGLLCQKTLSWNMHPTFSRLLVNDAIKKRMKALSVGDERSISLTRSSHNGRVSTAPTNTQLNPNSHNGRVSTAPTNTRFNPNSHNGRVSTASTNTQLNPNSYTGRMFTAPTNTRFIPNPYTGRMFTAPTNAQFNRSSHAGRLSTTPTSTRGSRSVSRTRRGRRASADKAECKSTGSTRAKSRTRGRDKAPSGRSPSHLKARSKLEMAKQVHAMQSREGKPKEEEDDESLLFPGMQRDYDDFARLPGHGMTSSQTRGPAKATRPPKQPRQKKESPVVKSPTRKAAHFVPAWNPPPDVSARDSTRQFYNRESKLVPSTKWEHDTTSPGREYYSESQIKKLAFEFDLVHRLGRGRRFSTTPRWSIENAEGPKSVPETRAKSPLRIHQESHCIGKETSRNDSSNARSRNVLQPSRPGGFPHPAPKALAGKVAAGKPPKEKVRALASAWQGRDYNMSAGRLLAATQARKRKKKTRTTRKKTSSQDTDSFSDDRRITLEPAPTAPKKVVKDPMADYRCPLLLDEVAKWYRTQIFSDRPQLAMGTSRTLQPFIGNDSSIRPPPKCHFAGDTSLPGNKGFTERALNNLMFRTDKLYNPIAKQSSQTGPPLFPTKAVIEADMMQIKRPKLPSLPPSPPPPPPSTPKRSEGSLGTRSSQSRIRGIARTKPSDMDAPWNSFKKYFKYLLDTDSPTHSLQYFKGLDPNSVLASKGFQEHLEMTTQSLPCQLEDAIKTIRQESLKRNPNWVDGFQTARLKNRPSEWRESFCEGVGARIIYMNRLHSNLNKQKSAFRLVGRAVVTKRRKSVRHVYRPDKGKALFKLVARSIMVRNRNLANSLED